MAHASLDYVYTIARKYPNCQVSCIGHPAIYENLRWEAGDPIPPEPELHDAFHEVMREEVWLHIKEERDRRKSAGAPVGDKWFHSDDTSRIQQIGLVMMGANIPPNLMWKTMDGSFVTMTQALAGQIFQTVAQRDQQIFAVAEQHRQAILALEHPHDYDWSTGWPMTFEENQASLGLSAASGA